MAEYVSTQDLSDALRRLTFAARTSGGTAGRDEELCAACEQAEDVLSRLWVNAPKGSDYWPFALAGLRDLHARLGITS